VALHLRLRGKFIDKLGLHHNKNSAPLLQALAAKKSKEESGHTLDVARRGVKQTATR